MGPPAGAQGAGMRTLAGPGGETACVNDGTLLPLEGLDSAESRDQRPGLDVAHPGRRSFVIPGLARTSYS